MAKFKVLKNNQEYMSRLGIYSNHLTEPTNDFLKCFFSYYVMSAMFANATVSGAFVCLHPSELKPALGAFKIGFAAMQCAGMFSGVGYKMVEVKALHLELQRIVDEGIV